MTKKSKQNSTKMNPAFKKMMFVKQPFELQEAFNTLRTNIRFASLDGNIKKIMVTSALPNEGKSCVSVNIAKSLAKNGSKVVLVDCDLRKPVLNKYLSITDRGRKGLTTFLCGETELNECLIFDENNKLYFLPAGIEAPNPTEMLGSRAFSRLIEYLGEKFDYVICDTPPAEVVSDAAVLSSLCDGVVFVVKHKYSKRDTVKNAVEALKSVNANILGIVLNEYEEEKGNKERYDYGYRYQKSKREF